jgi:hypothetical protein
MASTAQLKIELDVVLVNEINRLREAGRELLELKVCTGVHWKCCNGHKWMTLPSATDYFNFPNCPICGLQAVLYRGEWIAFKQFALGVADTFGVEIEESLPELQPVRTQF